MKEYYVLDSYALLTYLKEEPGWQKVKEVLIHGISKNFILYLNCVNLGEVYYIVYREKGPVLADKAVALIKQWPIKIIGVNEELAFIAGRMKAENKVSYADAYAIATALIKKATIVTGDKEFKSVEEIINIHWLPKNK